ncbi:MAG: NAD(P)H-hydrate dehydratase [Chloroflexota bacterium]
MKIVTSEEMRQIEQACEAHGLPTSVLMDNAGLAVARHIDQMTGGVSGRSVLVLIGPGNNGGDGLVAARHLHDRGAGVTLYLLKARPANDKNFILTGERRIAAIEAESDKGLGKLDSLLLTSDIILDAVFGTGKSRGISGVFKQVLERLGQKAHQGKQLVVALDLPSGLDADAGTVDPATPTADVTITLGFPKHGLFRSPGAETVGRLVLADIGIPPDLAKDIPFDLITDDWLKAVLPKRPLSANKGTFGKVLVIAGSVNYIGAAYLASMGAARVGAGLVTLALAKSLQPVLATKLAETTYLPLPEAEPGIIGPDAAGALKSTIDNYETLLIGCGLGQHPATAEFLDYILSRISETKRPTLVLDADALNLLSLHTQWWRRLPPDCVLTPHPGEMARLSGMSIDDIQRDRLKTAQDMAKRWGKTVVLKGAFTMIAAPDGRVRLSGYANPGLASAGTGDVLAGAIAGLAAQGLSLYDAAACGVALHAKAGEMVRSELGDTGMLAGDLLPALPKVIKGLK